MLKKRLIATLLARHGRIVQSIRFAHTNVIGNAITAVDFFNTWAVDEIVLLDVSRDQEFREPFGQIVRDLSERCFVPLTVGGWISRPEHVRTFLQLGADKVVINTEAYRQEELVATCARTFGSQCIVVSMDVRRDQEGRYEVIVDRGRQPTGLDPLSWARIVEERGAGEIYLTSIDQDGSRQGFDLELTRRVAEGVGVPVIASGGVGNWQHLVDGITRGGAAAVSAANIFHFTEHSTKKAKEYMVQQQVEMRETVFFKNLTQRKPKYEVQYRV
ncbi:MAG: imidazole glycerol phosphate synthase cyclase subunit [Thermodesulfobacteriota bacterium]